MESPTAAEILAERDTKADGAMESPTAAEILAERDTNADGTINLTNNSAAYICEFTWLLDSFNSTFETDPRPHIVKSPEMRTWWHSTVQVTLEVAFKGGFYVGKFNICTSKFKDDNGDTIAGTYFFKICHCTESEDVEIYCSSNPISPEIPESKLRWANYCILKLRIETTFVLTNPGFHYSACAYLMRRKYDSYKDQDTLTDLTIQVQEEQVKANKIVLAAASPAFEAMFCRDYKEAQTNYITIDDFDPHTVKMFVKYAYTYQKPSFNNVSEASNLFRMADYYQANVLKNMCYDYIENSINVNRKLLEDVLRF